MYQKLNPLLFLCTVLLFAYILTGCGGNSASGAKTFCDTVCMNDTLKFSKPDHPLQPYLYISAKDCNTESVIVSYRGMGVNRKFEMNPYRLSKDYVKCFFKDTSYVWLLFNRCDNGRGYSWKIPFSKTGQINKATSAINNIDPKFAVEDGIVAYTDKGNLFMEEMETGKKAMMTFGQQIDFDFDAIHEHLDSVNITRTKAWAKVKIGDEWVIKEKNITFQ